MREPSGPTMRAPDPCRLPATARQSPAALVGMPRPRGAARERRSAVLPEVAVIPPPVSTDAEETEMHPPETPTLSHRAGRGRDGLAAWIALPAEPGPDPTPLVAVHGIRRQARDQAEAFAARAAALGRPVVAPEFDEARWPLYQQAVRKGRADRALLALLEELRLAGIWRTPRVELFGYSGGAQFAHRFAMLHPHLVGRLSLAAAGWYTMPDAAPFPYGLGRRDGGDTDWGAMMGARLAEFLRLPVTVAVGALDDVPDGNTRRGEALDRQQGPHRRARAEAWVSALARAAAERGLSAPRIRLEVLPGTGHDFTECIARGGLAALVLPDPVAADACRDGAAASGPGSDRVERPEPCVATVTHHGTRY